MLSTATLRCLTFTFCFVACAGAEPDGEPAFAEPAESGAASPSEFNDPGGSMTTGASPAGSGATVTGLATDDPGALVDTSGCAKVDFLFVVDNSLSMLEEQTALVNSFPGFMDIVEQTLGASDFHVMVVDTDAAGVGDAISSLLGRGDEVCGPVLGAGRRHDQGGEECGLASERRYLDAAEADLASAFSCIAEVGTFGSASEAPVDAMLASLGPSLNAPGGCNAGFLRDDAILVVTLIGDEDDVASSGEPDVWREALVQAKAGSAESIVILGLVGGDGEAASSACSEADPAPRLHRLIESFSFGSVGDICSSDYAPFFASAVSVIDTACAGFEPPVLR